MYDLQQYVPDAQTFTGEYIPQQLMPQSLFGGLFGSPLGNTYGCGPSGSLGQRVPNFLPFSVDPAALALSNQQTAAGGYVPQHLMLQSLFGRLLPPRLSDSLGCGPSGSLGQRTPTFGLLPFGVDPVALAYAQAQAQAMQAML